MEGAVDRSEFRPAAVYGVPHTAPGTFDPATVNGDMFFRRSAR
jgi:hypothetical protein